MNPPVGIVSDFQIGDTVKYTGTDRQYRGVKGTLAGMLRGSMACVCVRHTSAPGCYDVMVPVRDLQLVHKAVGMSWSPSPAYTIASAPRIPAAAASRPAAAVSKPILFGEYLTYVKRPGKAAPVCEWETGTGLTLVTVFLEGEELTLDHKELYSDFRAGVTAALRADKGVVGEVILEDEGDGVVGINVSGELRSFEAAKLFVLAPGR